MSDPAWFRIYYRDGSVYEGDPFLAPAAGVQVIALEDGLLHGGEGDLRALGYYWFEEGTWWGGDWAGAFQYMLRPGPRRVLFGESIDTERFLELIRRAGRDRRAHNAARG